MAASLMLALNVQAEERTFSSPDGKIQVCVCDTDGKPGYSITYDGNQFLKPSPLGLMTSIGDYTQGLTMMPEKAALRLVEESYTLRTIKQSQVDYKATEAVCTFAKEDRPVMDIIFRISDRDVALKYRAGRHPLMRRVQGNDRFRHARRKHFLPLPAGEARRRMDGDIPEL